MDVFECHTCCEYLKIASQENALIYIILFRHDHVRLKLLLVFHGYLEKSTKVNLFENKQMKCVSHRYADDFNGLVRVALKYLVHVHCFCKTG